MAFVGVSSFLGAKKPAFSAAKCRRSLVTAPRMSIWLPQTQEEEKADDEALKKFTQEVANERNELLQRNYGAVADRLTMWNDGVSSNEMLTFFGQLRNNYAKRHGLKDYDYQSLDGNEISSVPGTSITRPIGAIDFLLTDDVVPGATIVGIEQVRQAVKRSAEEASDEASVYAAQEQSSQVNASERPQLEPDSSDDSDQWVPEY